MFAPASTARALIFGPVKNIFAINPFPFAVDLLLAGFDVNIPLEICFFMLSFGEFSFNVKFVVTINLSPYHLAGHISKTNTPGGHTLPVRSAPHELPIVCPMAGLG